MPKGREKGDAAPAILWAIGSRPQGAICPTSRGHFVSRLRASRISCDRRRPALRSLTAPQNGAVAEAHSLFDLTGRVAVVTGASSGLGAHFARVLRSHGAMLVLAGRREERLNALARELGSENAEAVPADVSDEGAVVALVDRAV